MQCIQIHLKMAVYFYCKLNTALSVLELLEGVVCLWGGILHEFNHTGFFAGWYCTLVSQNFIHVWDLR